MSSRTRTAAAACRCGMQAPCRRCCFMKQRMMLSFQCPAPLCTSTYACTSTCTSTCMHVCAERTTGCGAGTFARSFGAAWHVDQSSEWSDPVCACMHARMATRRTTSSSATSRRRTPPSTPACWPRRAPGPHTSWPSAARCGGGGGREAGGGAGGVHPPCGHACRAAAHACIAVTPRHAKGYMLASPQGPYVGQAEKHTGHVCCIQPCGTGRIVVHNKAGALPSTPHAARRITPRPPRSA